MAGAPGMKEAWISRRCAGVAAALLVAGAGGCRERDASEQREPDVKAETPAEGAERSEREPPPLPEAVELAAAPDAHSGDPLWAVRFGGATKDAARDIAALGEGAVVAGYVSGTATLGDVTHEASEIDAYITRLDGEGRHVWSAFFSGEGENSANSIAVTEDDEIVVAGAFAHGLTIGDGELDGFGADDIFVAKFSPDGKRVWARSFGGHDIDAAHYVATGPGGRIYVTGVFRDEVRFGEHTLESAGDADIFALVLSADGEPIWAKRFGARGPDYGRALVPHPRGVALLAEFSLEVEIGEEALRSAGNRDLLIALLDPDGDPIWADGIGGYYHDVGVELAVDPAGDLIVTGAFDDEVDFGGGAHESAGQSDVFVLKLDADGDHLWSKRAGGNEEDVGGGVATDRHGHVFTTGWFWYELDFGGPSVASAGRRDGYVAKLSPAGEPIWSHRMGGELGDMARAVAVGDDGRVFVAGTFHQTATFGDVELTAARESEDSQVPYGDAFVVVFEP